MTKKINTLILILLVIVLVGIFSACDTNTETEIDKGPFTITVNGGYINGNTELTVAEFPYGEQITITAIIPEGKEFVGWYVDNLVFSTKAELSFTVYQNRNIVGQVQDIVKQKYTISVDGGYINNDPQLISGTFYENDTISLTAIVPSGKVFTKWTIDGNVISKSNPYSNYSVTKNAAIVANFRDVGETPEEEDVCTLTLSGGKIVSTSSTTGTYSNGTQVKIKADTPHDKNFVGWYEDGKVLSTNQEYTYTIKYSVSLEARFEMKPTFTVTVVNGTKNSSDTVYQGSSVTFTAQQSTNERVFDHWEIEGNNQSMTIISKNTLYTTTVQANIVATAYYKTKVLISATDDTGNNIYNGYIDKVAGSISIIAPNKVGKVFDSWRDAQGNVISLSKTIIIQGKEQAYSVVAYYENVESTECKLTVINGKAYSAYESSTYSNEVSNGVYDIGTVVYIKPDYEGSTIKVNGNVINGNQIALESGNNEIECVKTITVNAQLCRLIDGNSVASIDLEVGKEYVFVGTLDKEAKIFNYWTVNGVEQTNDIEVDESHYLVIKITNDITSISINSTNMFNIKVINGTINGKGSDRVEQYKTATIIANDIEGKTFVGWKKGSSMVVGATAKEYEITVQDNATYEAIYE